jgi:hypothetical protein
MEQNSERILLMEHLNMMPINQKAKEFLQETDEELRADSFYCVQLVNHALNRGEIEAEEDLAQTVRAMMAWRPERIMNFLMIAPGTEYSPRGWQKAEDYRELAKIILDDIEEKMVKHFPWYRSGE